MHSLQEMMPILEASLPDNRSKHDSPSIEAQGSGSSIARERSNRSRPLSATAHVFVGNDISQIRMVKEEVLQMEDAVVNLNQTEFSFWLGEQIAAMESRKGRTTQPLSVVSYYAGKDISQMKLVKDEDDAVERKQSATVAAPVTLLDLLGPATGSATTTSAVMKAAASTLATATSQAATKRSDAPITRPTTAEVFLSKRAALVTKMRAEPTGTKVAPVASPPNAAGEWACEVCDQAFKDKFARAHHMISQHRDTRTQQKKGAKVKQHTINTAAYSRQFQCEVCPSRFSLNNSLLQHLRTEHNLPPYECRACNQRFFYLADLTRHGNEEH
ncbi:hypothetical protein PRIPAC_94616 [Pristionchus pacificus]|uniref:Zinc finger protein n=1 Tax=Pristionchus pacificus TaxID=54126 RepID=A0A2A6CIF2_PRIPA|nr:hypothetical protein PRIPAC_94616 [Pristionchus pacificus]|eukprot:PDM77886.1 zinc finger protein [Pristionchus pacificus]